MGANRKSLETNITGPPGWGLGVGLTPLHRKKNIVIKPQTLYWNRFEVLQDTSDLEDEYDRAVEVYRETARDVTGKTKKQSKPWILVREGRWKNIKRDFYSDVYTILVGI